jgi:hypothetical protein
MIFFSPVALLAFGSQSLCQDLQNFENSTGLDPFFSQDSYVVAILAFGFLFISQDATEFSDKFSWI